MYFCIPNGRQSTSGIGVYVKEGGPIAKAKSKQLPDPLLTVAPS